MALGWFVLNKNSTETLSIFDINLLIIVLSLRVKVLFGSLDFEKMATKFKMESETIFSLFCSQNFNFQPISKTLNVFEASF
jgi:hypothetical protein